MKKHIPNTLTLLNLLSGGLGVILIAEGQLKLAAIMILVGAVFDVFDGLSARLLGVSSPIGAQLDSMADMVTFGVLPAILGWKMLSLTALTWPPALAYLPLGIAAGAALRLARFNIEDDSSGDFRGLPSPASALMICGLAIAFADGISWLQDPIILLVIFSLLPLLMNSQWAFFSLKSLSAKNTLDKIKLAILLIALALIIAYQALGLAFAITLYIFASIIISITKPNEFHR